MNKLNQHEKLDFVINQNTYMLGLLENNYKTGQKGYIQRTNDLEGRVDKMEVNDKVRLGKVSILSGFVGGIIVPGAWWVGKLMFKFFI